MGFLFKKFPKKSKKATGEVCVGPASGGAEGTFQLEAVLRAKLPCCWREEGHQKSLVIVRNAERYLWKHDASNLEAKWPQQQKEAIHASSTEDWKNITSSDGPWFLLWHLDGSVRIVGKQHESMDPSSLINYQGCCCCCWCEWVNAKWAPLKQSFLLPFISNKNK